MSLGITVPNKSRREDMARQIQEYLDKGGVITKLPPTARRYDAKHQMFNREQGAKKIDDKDND